jgi:hypothetical protein
MSLLNIVNGFYPILYCFLHVIRIMLFHADLDPQQFLLQKDNTDMYKEKCNILSHSGTGRTNS